MRLAYIFGIALLVLVSCSSPDNFSLESAWKVKAGDDSTYALPGIKLSGWDEIMPGKSWEEQGLEGIDSIVWYRKDEIFNDSLKLLIKEDYPFLVFELGKIDDADECYFNGTMVGTTGTFSFLIGRDKTKERVYMIPGDLIQWDAVNTVAIKVMDHEGQGGLYEGPYNIRSATWEDLFAMTVSVDGGLEGYFDEGMPMMISAEYLNNIIDEINGSVKCVVANTKGEQVFTAEDDIIAIPGEKASYYVEYQPGEKGFYIVTTTFTPSGIGETIELVDTVAYMYEYGAAFEE